MAKFLGCWCLFSQFYLPPQVGQVLALQSHHQIVELVVAPAPVELAGVLLALQPAQHGHLHLQHLLVGLNVCPVFILITEYLTDRSPCWTPPWSPPAHCGFGCQPPHKFRRIHRHQSFASKENFWINFLINIANNFPPLADDLWRLQNFALAGTSHKISPWCSEGRAKCEKIIDG